MRALLIIGSLSIFLVCGCYSSVSKKPPQKEKETHTLVNSLSADEISKITSYKEKYQTFPGPSDTEVLDVAKILLSAKLTSDKVEQLLGKPSHIYDSPDIENKQSLLKCWGYDIGDSRSIVIRFNVNGRIVSIYGVGVGFDTLIPSSEHK